MTLTQALSLALENILDIFNLSDAQRAALPRAAQQLAHDLPVLAPSINPEDVDPAQLPGITDILLAFTDLEADLQTNTQA